MMDKEIKMRNKPRCTQRKIAAKSRLFSIECLDLEFSNGAKRQYERLVKPNIGAVLIIPMLDAQTLLLIREYAAGTERYELGFPKGLVEAGETTFEAADRELKEEVGYGAKKMHGLKALSSSPSFFGLMIDLVVATELYQERLEGDEPEPVEVIPWPLARVDDLLGREDFSEARSIAAIYLLKNYLSDKGVLNGE